MYEKGNNYGKRFSSTYQPKVRTGGRKPSIYKQLKKLIGKQVGFELEEEDYHNLLRSVAELTPNDVRRIQTDRENIPIWLTNILSAINTDTRNGNAKTVEMILERVFGKSKETKEVNVSGTIDTITQNLDALSTEELIQYNNLLDKMRRGTGTPQEDAAKDEGDDSPSENMTDQNTDE